MIRERQKILIVREYVSSLTRGRIIKSEKEEDLREGIIQLISDLVSLDGPPSTIRTDGAPGFRSLVADEALKNRRIIIEIGRAKNVNKNPVGERAVQEVQSEILRFTGQSGPITPSTLNDAINSLNSRIRTDGLSAREIFYQRDQYTNAQIPIEDMDIIQSKHERAVNNNFSSELSKSGGRGPRTDQVIAVGDLIYLISDRSKNSPRDRYLVVSIEREWCCIRKFIGNTLKSNSYRVKKSEIYKVPPTTLPHQGPEGSMVINLGEDAIFTDDPTDQADQPLKEPQNNTPPPELPPPEMSPLELPPSVPLPPQMQDADSSSHTTAEINAPIPLPSIGSPLPATTPPASVAPTPPTPPEILTRPEPVIVAEHSEQPLRRSTRARRPPARLRDYDLSQE